MAEELLFRDGLPDLDNTEGYIASIAAKAAGISYRQLDYWASTGLATPSVKNSAGCGSQRLYSFKDILTLKIIKTLLNTGISLAKIRKAILILNDKGITDLTPLTLISDGSSVYLCLSENEIIDILKNGQAVFAVSIGNIIDEISKSFNMSKNIKTHINALNEKRRIYRAQKTPKIEQ